MVETLLALGADPTIASTEGTAADVALHNKHAATAALLPRPSGARSDPSFPPLGKEKRGLKVSKRVKKEKKGKREAKEREWGRDEAFEEREDMWGAGDIVSEMPVMSFASIRNICSTPPTGSSPPTYLEGNPYTYPLVNNSRTPPTSPRS